MEGTAEKQRPTRKQVKGLRCHTFKERFKAPKLHFAEIKEIRHVFFKTHKILDNQKDTLPVARATRLIRQSRRKRNGFVFYMTVSHWNRFPPAVISVPVQLAFKILFDSYINQ